MGRRFAELVEGADLRDTLLPKVIFGEMRVKGPEHILGRTAV